MDLVNHPGHYTAYKHEVIELTRQLPFDAGNCVKYIVRAPFKNGIEDLQKAVWYARDMLNPSSSMMDISMNEQKVSSINSLTAYFMSVVQQSDIPCSEIFGSLLASVVSYSLCNSERTAKELKNNIQYLIELIEQNRKYRTQVDTYRISKS